MKLYISVNTEQPAGVLTGTVSSAVAELEKQGHQAYSPLSHDVALLPWSLRLEALVSECQGIYLLAGWQDSIECSTERHLCLAAGKSVFFQSAEHRQSVVALTKAAITAKIQEALHEATGMTLDQYRIRRRTDNLVFARMVFTYQGKKMGLAPDDISKELNISRSMVYHYLKVYPGEIRFNPKFRGLAERVGKLIQ